jgi:threonine aldolase
LCGPADVIAEARAHRARLGGGMRQAGVIAAAGIVALETMVDRLTDDHARARTLAEALAERWPRSVEPNQVTTNIVCVRADAVPEKFIARLGDLGVRAGTIDARTIRFVTHKDVDDAAIDRVIATFDTIRAEA